MKQLPVYILAGGKSQRFGSDKARATIDGAALIVRIARALAPIADNITVVADKNSKYNDLGLTTIADTTPDQGPLGGLARALEHTAAHENTDWLWLVPCDWINPDIELLRPLDQNISDDATAVVYHADRWQPMPGLYHQSLRAAVADHLHQQQRAMWQLLEQARGVATVNHEAGRQIQQANAPADLPRAQSS